MKYDNRRYFEIVYGKPIYAQWFASIDIYLWVGAETITNVNFSASNRETGDDVTSVVLDAVKSTYTGNRYLKPFIKSGVVGTKYRIKMEVDTTEESQEEFYLDFYIRDG